MKNNNLSSKLLHPGKFEIANKRKHSFWNNEMPLTSKRARFIISNEIESKRLANAVRNGRAEKGTNISNQIVENKFTIRTKAVISQFEKMK